MKFEPALTGLLCVLAVLVSGESPATEPLSPVITNFQAQGTTRTLRFAPYPAAEDYSILSASNLSVPFAPDAAFRWGAYTNAVSTNTSGYEWRSTNGGGASGFYRVRVTPMADSNRLAATVLQRLTYGPTPDELDRIRSVGPEAYIAEQLAPWSLAEKADMADTNLPFLEARFAAFNEPITNTTKATLTDYRAWHVLRAVNASRQMLEILLQFVENHFVTEYGKSYNWLNNNYATGIRRSLAAQMEYAENQRWRAALLNPQCTFHDLLKISAESPAMIIYLDSVTSRGDSGRIANENYARELFELFCWGVDNGYDQTDITVMSRAWTGWSVEIVDPVNALNPFALRSTNYMSPVDTNTSVTNISGVYAFNYKNTYHNTNSKTLCPGKTVPARFGPPWAGRPCTLVLNNGSGTNGIQDGYQALLHLANQPFTAEYLSIKLCRLLVHDHFPNPTTMTHLPEYAFYDYTRPDLSPEARLVHDCMMAWETNSPKGQIWKVIRTITDSDLFRSHTASLQKVKTPLEYTVSAIRALRSSTNASGLDGTFTADTDGFAISGTNLTEVDAQSPLLRMGTMLLFDREAPDGYPEDGPSWISAGTLAERIRWIQSYCLAPGTDGHRGHQEISTTNDAQNSVCYPVKLLKARLSPDSWTNAPAVADYFLRTLYPAEGSGNLTLYRDAAVNFLNTDETGASSPFADLTNTSGAAYDNRVRGMVGMLLTSQRFHEQ